MSKGFDWMSAFKAKNTECSRCSHPKLDNNEVLVICHNDIEEQEKSKTFCESQRANFTFASVTNGYDGLKAIDDIWEKNFSIIIFATCEDDHCKAAIELRLYLRDHSSIRRYRPWLTLLSEEDTPMAS